jgi:sigma-B regulation protein RsbU (phosphoserine phosphatase)
MKEDEVTDAGISEKGTRLLHELKTKQLQLHWLLQITKAINYDLPSHQLFEVFQVVLKDHLKVGKAVLFLKDISWHKSLEYGCKIDIENIQLEELFSATNMENNTNSPVKWFNDFETIIPVYHNDKPLAYALVGDFENNAASNPREFLPFIHTITNIIVVAIENKRLTRESIQQAAMGRELELAAKMQAMLFPQQLPSNRIFEMAATYLPHQQVGGDYYDYFQINEDEAILCMADISGKGISAALLMSNFQANLHALIKLRLPLTELIYELNECVNKSAKGEKFITFFIAHINNKEHTLRYINAGHNPPVLMQNKQFSLLETGTTGLGMFEELPFIYEGLIDFPEDSILFCYTDGITDIEDHNGNLFGIEKIQEILKNHSDVYTMNDLHMIFIDAFHKFKGPHGFTDDITMLSCKSVRHR